MADLTFIDWSTHDILEEIKTQYKTITGNELIIGSDEFAIASVVAYILGVAKERFNAMARQRYLSTANGEYLDAIAETLGLSDRPKDYKARCTVRIRNLEAAPYGILKGFEVSDNAGHVFESCYYVSVPENGYLDVLFESKTSDTSNNNLPVGAITTIVDPDITGLTVYNMTITQGADPEPFPYTDEGDDLYRQYIKDTYNGVSAAGSFYTYRKLAMQSDPRVEDAYVLKSGDTGFQKGKVKIFWSNSEIGGEISDSAYYTQQSINAVIKDYIENSDLMALNDIILSPEYAQAARTTTAQYAVYYDEKKYDWSFISAIVENARAEYCKFLRTHMGSPFSCVEFFEYIRKQENGDCITYIAPMSTSPDFVNCKPWQVAIDETTIQLIDFNIIPG